MEAYLERLYHYRCDHCQKWWTVGDIAPQINQEMHCPHCGKKNVIQGVTEAASETPNSNTEIYWDGRKFIAQENPHRSHLEAVQIHQYKTTQFLKRCDFQLEGYRVVDGQIMVNKGNGVEFKEEDEGRGFVICLHLFTYLMEGYSVDSESFRRQLHPVLFKALERWFLGWQYESYIPVHTP